MARAFAPATTPFALLGEGPGEISLQVAALVPPLAASVFGRD